MLYRKTALLTAATAALAALAAPQAAYAEERPGGRSDVGIDGSGECTFPMKKQYEGRPWSLQRVLLDELWQDTKGEGVRVAVIDTGVDNNNPQLTARRRRLRGRRLPRGQGRDPRRRRHRRRRSATAPRSPASSRPARARAPASSAWRPRPRSSRSGRTTRRAAARPPRMAAAIGHAIAEGAQVINISQDTAKPLTPDSTLGKAVRGALAQGRRRGRLRGQRRPGRRAQEHLSGRLRRRPRRRRLGPQQRTRRLLPVR